MKVKDIIDKYYTYTTKLSDISRHLAFAGIGIVWIFNTSKNGGIMLDTKLIIGVLLFGVALIKDVGYDRIG